MKVSMFSVTWMHSQRAGRRPGWRDTECVPRLGTKRTLWCRSGWEAPPGPGPPRRAVSRSVDVAGSPLTAKAPERLVSERTPAPEPVSRPVGLTRCQPGWARGQRPASQVALTPVALVQNQSEFQCHPGNPMKPWGHRRPHPA